MPPYHLHLFVIVQSLIRVSVNVIVVVVVVVGCCLRACGVLFLEMFYYKVRIIRFDVMK